MRTEFAWEMSDALVRDGGRVLLRHHLRGVEWPGALGFWLVSAGLVYVAVATEASWLLLVLASTASVLVFLVLLIAVVWPLLQGKSITAYLHRLASWPHRRVQVAVTPDAILLTSPVGQGLIELADLREILHDPQTTVLLFRDGSIVPVPTEAIPIDARTLLRFPTQGATP